jgi:hypothetical protein
VGGLAFDIDRQALVLFGGYAADPRTVLNDTWEWNIKAGWRQLHPATTPPARGMTAMAYDQARHVVLMYGGRNTAGGTMPCGEVGQDLCSTDTWTWNGTDWSQLHPDINPYPFLPTMTYDQSSDAPLVYSSSAETWSWNGAEWTVKASEAGRPDPHRSTPVMAFDPATRHVVMFGGFNHGAGDLNTMWSWTGQGWTSLGTQAPFRILQAAAAADMDRRVLLGYQNPYVKPPVPPIIVASPAETWAWDGVRWTQLHPVHEPTAWVSAMFADPKSHQVLLVGTNFTKSNAIEIWVWNGDDWSQLG